MRHRTWNWVVAGLCAAGCAGTPEPAPERTDPDAVQAATVEALDRALAEGERARAAKDWVAAWEAYEKAATLDTGRRHDAAIAEARFAIGYAIAIDGARIDLFGLLPDRQRGIDYLITTARQHRYTDVEPKALFYAAKGYRLIDQPDLAQLYLDELVRHYGADGTDADRRKWAEAADHERILALLQAARTLENDLAPLEEAYWRLQVFLELYPDGANAPAARTTLETVADHLAERDYRTGRWYEQSSLPDAARRYYDEVRRRFPTSHWAEDAAGRLAGLPAPAEVWPPERAPTDATPPARPAGP